MLESVTQMDGNTRPPDVSKAKEKALKGYTVHLLALDGTITTVRQKESDNDATVELTVENRDGKAERELPAALAQNIRSAEFRRVVREVKAELLDRDRRRACRRAR